MLKSRKENVRQMFEYCDFFKSFPGYDIGWVVLANLFIVNFCINTLCKWNWHWARSQVPGHSFALSNCYKHILVFSDNNYIFQVLLKWPELHNFPAETWTQPRATISIPCGQWGVARVHRVMLGVQLDQERNPACILDKGKIRLYRQLYQWCLLLPLHLHPHWCWSQHSQDQLSACSGQW